MANIRSPRRASLAKYREKRDFARTPEPRGKKSRGGWLFVVQKHAARRLHYDFRLELDGALKSWAVPKGPSLDPKAMRLAVAVEDHPIEYGDFEGVIPAGEYGGGTVVLWDRGTWSPIDDPHEGLARGKLKFALQGKKLQGEWILIRTTPHRARGEQWLLRKIADRFARSQAEYDVLAQQPQSVASRRVLAEVAEDRDRVWSSKASASDTARSHSRRTARHPERSEGPRQILRSAQNDMRSAHRHATIARIPVARRTAMPKNVPVALATLVARPPDGDQWLHEIKLDGYRMIGHIENGRARLISRGQQDWTERFPTVAHAASRLPCKRAIVDGEVVMLLPNGTSSFQALQNVLHDAREDQLVYQLFDLLYLDGYDLRKATLENRKAALAELLGDAPPQDSLRLTEHVVGHGPEFFDECCRLGLEGTIAKRRDRPYPTARSTDWLKVKCLQRQEFVIGGYTDSTDRNRKLGAIHVGYFDTPEKLQYAGRVGTGWTDRSLSELHARLAPLARDECPFANCADAARAHGSHWVEPRLVAEVAFSNWTRDGRLRHPSFQGLRDDKPPDSVRQELPVDGKSRIPRGRKAEQIAARMRGGKSTPAIPSGAKDLATGPKHGRRVSPKILEKQLAGVRLTHPDKVLYADQGITKLGLVSYYIQVADWILPHVAGRPLSLVRCPDGEGQGCFYQKHVKPSADDGLGRIAIREDQTVRDYVIVKDVAGLAALVQMGVLEIHPWGARVDDIERPDRLTFDLDPGPAVAWTVVIETARRLRALLAELKLESFPKTTGGKGLHVVVPIVRRQTWPEAKAFSLAVAKRLVDGDPGHLTIRMAKSARPGKIFVDYLRNQRGATAVAAYSTRARPGAPVSVPLAWEELSAEVRADHYGVANLPPRLAALRRDPWDGFFEVRQSIGRAVLRRLGL
jgi:bifunctional non-homologous end joining protein LigD